MKWLKGFKKLSFRFHSFSRQNYYIFEMCPKYYLGSSVGIINPLRHIVPFSLHLETDGDVIIIFFNIEFYWVRG
ncbi:MAG: hypothetical protein WDA74_06175 [Spirochaetota bacterium]